MNKYIAGVVVVIGLAMVRVVSTYPVLNGTYDEPAHIGCGMEWLRGGTYTCDLQHPPLARIAVALGPYLKGLRLAAGSNAPDHSSGSFYEEGTEILYSDGHYWSNLTWARIGTLPFLVLLCIVTFLWARRCFGDAPGFWAALLLACTSPILGHAGLATNDVACAAGAALALYQFLRWLEQPSAVRCVWWGLATAFAVLCKFSNIPFLATCYAAGLIIITSPLTRGDFRRRLPQIGLAACVAFALVWATYRFSLIPPVVFYGPHHPVIDSMLSSHPLLDSVWNSVMSTPLPLSQATMGVLDLSVHNALGHDSYLLGQWSPSGWWHFFPVVLAVKSPIGLLALSMCGWWLVLRRWRDTDWKQSWPQLLTIVFPLAILLVCMLARIDLGVRHILPVYPLLAIAGGHAVTGLFQQSRYAAIVAAFLVAWVIGDSVRAHPDYLAHFNEFAGSHPEAILSESDLDWGQDLHRLSQRLKERGVQEFSIAYFGTALLEKAELPRYALLSPTQPSRGYIAVSLRNLNIEYKKNGSYAWLKSYTPVERIGKSIDLFYIAP
ncbi:MAG: glycosyltransferase family 39 protein [Acidobacteriia bacterium]|nr:glycosyltransferase family 39 protein [Terriglobia bacterium]